MDLVDRVGHSFRIGTIGHATDLYQGGKLGTVVVLQVGERGLTGQQSVVLAGVFILVIGSAGSAVGTRSEQGNRFEG